MAKLQLKRWEQYFRKETKKYPLTFESEVGKSLMANKELLKTPLGKKLVEQMKKNAANTPK